MGPEDVLKKIEWIGVKNQILQLLSTGVEGKRVMMISSMSTTNVMKDDHILFYKLNAEAFLASSGVAFAIIKPCGLAEDPAGQRELMVGHDDTEPWFSEGFYMVPREDVAAVAVEALESPPADNLRFDLCAKLPGSGPPASAQKLLEQSMYPWQRHHASLYL